MMEKYQLNNEEVETISKVAWKNKVKKVINNNFKIKLLEKIKQYRKIDCDRKAQEKF